MNAARLPQVAACCTLHVASPDSVQHLQQPQQQQQPATATIVASGSSINGASTCKLQLLCMPRRLSHCDVFMDIKCHNFCTRGFIFVFVTAHTHIHTDTHVRIEPAVAVEGEIQLVMFMFMFLSLFAAPYISLALFLHLPLSSQLQLPHKSFTSISVFDIF